MEVLDNLVIEYQDRSLFLGQVLWNMLLIFKTTFYLTLVLHCLACFWVRVGLFFTNKIDEASWIEEFGLEDFKN
jgi:hypothetical protein